LVTPEPLFTGERLVSREPHKFDPKRAERLDHPERQEFLPNEKVLDLLGLRGDETVVDYGAGSGTLAVPLATRLPGGVVHAIDESPEMVALLRERLEGANLQNVVPYEIRNNKVPLEDGAVDRILAVKLMHEVIGETALDEMRRLLAQDGLLLVVDWRGDLERESGPPKEVTFSPEAGREMIEAAGLVATPVPDAGFPYHFALLARHESP
jgi:ubiquinone/menaquinone biosynthesis C-methylase UbiE